MGDSRSATRWKRWRTADRPTRCRPRSRAQAPLTAAGPVDLHPVGRSLVLDIVVRLLFGEPLADGTHRRADRREDEPRAAPPLARLDGRPARRGGRSRGRRVQLQGRVPSEHVEARVCVQHRHLLANRHGGDEAVDQPSNGLASTSTDPVQGGTCLVVNRTGREDGGAAASRSRASAATRRRA